MRLNYWFWLCLCVVGVSDTTVVDAAKPDRVPMVELRLSDDTIEGRILHKNADKALLYDRTGRLRQVPLKQVESFQQSSSEFAALTPLKLSTELRQELGREFETATSRHFVVAAPKGHAKAYVEVFEDVYRSFYMYFSVRGFDLMTPEFPMVAIIFPNQQSFAGYAAAENVKVSKGLAGYYMPNSNRVALFEQNDRRQSRVFQSPLLGTDSGDDSPLLPNHFAAIQAELRDTMIHEATHQIAFNVGLHDRLGDNPKWIVEGLATVYEAPGIRQSAKGHQLTQRINPERLEWFKKYVKERRKKDSLNEFISSDQLFDTAALDAYAEAWALSFFLVETRPRQYSDFMHRMANRDSMKALKSDERLQTFHKVFGSNTKMLEAEFLRFYERLK